MRLVKQTAVQALFDENRKLQVQEGRCQRQEQTIAGFSVAGMSGEAASAMVQVVRAQGASVAGIRQFCKDLEGANARTSALIRDLPTTSPGVVDTDEAQRKMDEAKLRADRFDRTMRYEIAKVRAQRQSGAVSSNMMFGTSGGLTEAQVRSMYTSMIQAEKATIAANEQVLQKVREFERESIAAYQAVSTSTLEGMWNSAASLVAGRGLSSTTWIGDYVLPSKEVVESGGAGVSIDTDEPVLDDDPTTLPTMCGAVAGAVGAAKEFLSDEHTLYETNLYESADGSSSVDVSLLHYEPKLDPSISQSVKIKKGENEREDILGVEASAEFNLAEMNYSDVKDYNGTPINTKVAAAVGAVSGSVEAGLSFRDEKGKLDPRFAFEAKANASVAHVEASREAGEGINKAGCSLEGDALTGEAKAEFEVGKDGVAGEAGAECYLLTGKATGYVEILGVKFMVEGEAKVGGAGASIEFAAKDGELDFGLGVGVGVGLGGKLKVDYSDLATALADGTMSELIDESREHGFDYFEDMRNL